jgi:DNA-binding FadR family transcriptional regulator
LAVGPSRSDDQRTRKTAERVASDIVSDIVARGLHTGDRLPLEAAMIETYGASRASIREALRLLEVQGVLVIKPGPGGGPVVGRVDPANLARTTSLYFHLGGATYESVLRTQALFEPICTQLAAHHPERRRVMERFVSSPPLRTAAAWRRHDAELHAAIQQLATNPIIAMLTQAIARIVVDHVHDLLDPAALGPSARTAHAAIARAVASGEAETAGRHMFSHLKAQHDHYRAVAPELLDQLIEWR